MTSTMMRKSLMVAAGATLGALSLAMSEPSQAAFIGAYAPANFTLTNTNADGSVDTSDAPASISITGGNNNSNSAGSTQFLTTAAGNGLVSFDWNYFTLDVDGASFDPFGYSLNGAFTQLTTGGLPGQSGNASFNVALGDLFGFEVQTTDNVFGRGSATISNFTAPTAIPTPALLPGLIGLGVGVWRKRKAEAVAEKA